MNNRKKAGIISAVVIVLLLLLYGFWPRPVEVDAWEIKSEPFRVTIEEEGRTRVKDRYVITSPVSGIAMRLDRDVGDKVSKGETLLCLEPLRSDVLDPRRRAEAQARVQATKAALEAAKETANAAKADADLAQNELKRMQGLFKEGSATQQMLDQAEANARRAKAHLTSSNFAVEVARYEYKAAQTTLRYSAAEGVRDTTAKVPITSPVDGNILKIHHKSEGVVAAGQALVEVGNSRALEVETDVLSSDAVKIAPGTRVVYDRWGGDKPLNGIVRTVEPIGFTKISALGVEEQRVLVISDIVSPQNEWKRLGDGYRVISRFIVWENDKVLQVPTSALFRKDQDWAVFVINNKRAHLRKVDIGVKSGLMAEVLSGLKDGDLVITHPDEALEDGTRVSIRAK
ncbi:MAG TPA: HlyD family efflux transporter periplasmic adaptor subunit [Balneolales bacterium]|nr:HlyD family efflux transporter periplasmic adaptor subunit [Balneolales bacterium]